MDEMAKETLALIRTAEATVGSLIHPAELNRLRKMRTNALRELRNDYIKTCQQVNAAHVKSLMNIVTHHDVQAMSTDAVPVFDPDAAELGPDAT